VTKRLPAITAKELLKILKAHGFREARQSGSHVIMRHPDGRRTVVPVHSGKDLGKGLLRKILRETELGVDDLA